MRLKSIIGIIILSILLISCKSSNVSTKLEDEIIEGDITFYVANDDVTGWTTYNKEVNGGLIDIIEQ